MKRSSLKISVLALVMGVGAAMATSAHASFANQTWGRKSATLYINVTGQHQGSDYTCSGTTSVCTAVYPAGQDPNVNPANPISTTPGTFAN